jgi:hypothetical protein
MKIILVTYVSMIGSTAEIALAPAGEQCNWPAIRRWAAGLSFEK